MRLVKILIIVLAVLAVIAVAVYAGHSVATQLLGQQIAPQHLIVCDGMPGPCPS